MLLKILKYGLIFKISGQNNHLKLNLNLKKNFSTNKVIKVLILIIQICVDFGQILA